MTFDLIRLGWPNTVVVAALAILPIVTLSMAAATRPPANAAQVAYLESDTLDAPIALSELQVR